MDFSKGENGSGVLDVLAKQTDDTSAEHKIQIKKIYGGGFDNIKKPTDLILEDVTVNSSVLETELEMPENITEQKVGDNVETKLEKKFEIPQALLRYIDVLIVEKKLPLRTLRFDIEFAKSNEEIAQHLESYVQKSSIIPQEDLKKLFGFIGYEKGDEAVVESTVTKEEVKEDVKEVQEETPTNSLGEYRSGYAELLVPYLAQIKKDKALYAKIMAELGGNTDMPLKDEPKELTVAREEYKNAKRESGVVGLLDELVEVEKLRAEVYKTEDSKLNAILNKAFASWDNYPNSGLVATSILGDVNDLEKIVDPAPFDGMRAEVAPEVVPEVVAEVPQAVVKETPVGEVVPEIQPEVQIEPKVEAKPVEVAVVEPEKSEIKFEIVGEGQIISDEAKRLAEGGEKLPVDNSVAEKVVEEQNSTALEFEGKKLEIVKGQGLDADKIQLVWGGIEIALGQITPKGTTIKIDRKFKSGFLLADTMEEKALKHAMPAIKALKS